MVMIAPVIQGALKGVLRMLLFTVTTAMVIGIACRKISPAVILALAIATLIQMPATWMRMAKTAAATLSAGFNVLLVSKFATTATVLIVTPMQRVVLVPLAAIATTTPMLATSMRMATTVVATLSAGFNVLRTTKFAMMAMDRIATPMLSPVRGLFLAQIARTIRTAPMVIYAWSFIRIA